MEQIVTKNVDDQNGISPLKKNSLSHFRDLNTISKKSTFEEIKEVSEEHLQSSRQTSFKISERNSRLVDVSFDKANILEKYNMSFEKPTDFRKYDMSFDKKDEYDKEYLTFIQETEFERDNCETEKENPLKQKRVSLGKLEEFESEEVLELSTKRKSNAGSKGTSETNEMINSNDFAFNSANYGKRVSHESIQLSEKKSLDYQFRHPAKLDKEIYAFRMKEKKVVVNRTMNKNVFSKKNDLYMNTIDGNEVKNGYSRRRSVANTKTSESVHSPNISDRNFMSFQFYNSHVFHSPQKRSYQPKDSNSIDKSYRNSKLRFNLLKTDKMKPSKTETSNVVVNGSSVFPNSEAKISLLKKNIKMRNS